MSQIKSKYTFAWYELDQPIEVGISGEFYFKREKKDVWVFHNGLMDDESVQEIKCTIQPISHQKFGSVQKIDTRGLDYTIHLMNGEKIRVEAEENPGFVYSLEKQLSDWFFEVMITLD